MMNMLLRRKCCCGTTLVKEWTASVCTSGSCVRTCAGAVATCVPTIKFCDAYRVSIGLPDDLDPTKCYVMVLGGCLYIVTGYAFVASCSSTQTQDRNVGSLLGVYDKPDVLPCESLCPDLRNNGYTYGPEVWTGGIQCGTNVQLIYPWTSAWCANLGGDVCDSTNLNPCIKKVGTITTVHNLASFPIGFAWPVTQCSTNEPNCLSCVYQNSNPQSTYWYFNEQIPTNRCNLAAGFEDICTVPSCSVSETFNCAVEQTASSEWTFSFGFSITRSCDYPIGDGTGWITGGPDSNFIVIDGCLFTLDTGCKSSTLAMKINDVLGGASQVGSTTFTATGTNAWIGQACNVLPGAECDGCLVGVYEWDGPYYTSGGKTATWYAAPILTYVFRSSLGTYNYSRDDGPIYGCRCSGSALGVNGGSYVSTNYNYGLITGPVIEYGVPLTGASFSMTDDPSVFPANPPCCPPPSMS